MQDARGCMCEKEIYHGPPHSKMVTAKLQLPSSQTGTTPGRLLLVFILSMCLWTVCRPPVECKQFGVVWAAFQPFIYVNLYLHQVTLIPGCGDWLIQFSVFCQVL